ncbi:MAG: hypothetical protein JWO83_3516 [Caulobacteraceae bacterium]|nr:hypothetical protein [Caulobacteraceae bacterium]
MAGYTNCTAVRALDVERHVTSWEIYEESGSTVAKRRGMKPAGFGLLARLQIQEPAQTGADRPERFPIQAADDAADAPPGNRDGLVDHDLGDDPQAIGRGRRNGDADEGRIRQLAGQGKDRDRGDRVEDVRLHHQGRPWLAFVA